MTAFIMHYCKRIKQFLLLCLLATVATTALAGNSSMNIKSAELVAQEVLMRLMRMSILNLATRLSKPSLRDLSLIFWLNSSYSRQKNTGLMMKYLP
ncbi:MAG: hypothetical protein RLZZ379_736 [Pseudomonadota bacterium]